MTSDELQAIRKRCEESRIRAQPDPGRCDLHWQQYLADVPALLAEVERLRTVIRDCVFLWDRNEDIAPDQAEADNARAVIAPTRTEAT